MIDGVSGNPYTAGPSGEAASGPAAYVGGLPLVSPRVNNRIVMINDVTPGAAPAFASVTVDGYYLPRYLQVRAPGA